MKNNSNVCVKGSDLKLFLNLNVPSSFLDFHDGTTAFSVDGSNDSLNLGLALGFMINRVSFGGRL